MYKRLRLLKTTTFLGRSLLYIHTLNPLPLLYTCTYIHTLTYVHPHTPAQVTSSLSFFLFSFQVHEKSILLACLPMSLLTAHHPFLVTTFQLTAAFSMYPLLTQDQLCLAVWALCCLYSLLSVLFLDRTDSELPLLELPVKLLVSDCLHAVHVQAIFQLELSW